MSNDNDKKAARVAAEEDVGEGASDATEAVKRLRKWAGEVTDGLSSRLPREAKPKKWIATAGRGVATTRGHARTFWKNSWGEDCERLVGESGFFRRFEIASTDSSVVPTATAEMAIGLSAATALATGGAAVLMNETALMRTTRSVMDTNSGPLQKMFRQVVAPGDRTAEINAFIDTVPGTEFAGGFAHRLIHGHDLAGLSRAFEEYGLEGAIEWLNHIVLRDSWTPSGVPILPFGSGEIYAFLKGMGVSPAMAADLLALNAAEALAGLGILTGTVRAAGLVQKAQMKELARQSALDAARDASAGNVEGARAAIDQMLRNDDTPENRLRAAIVMVGGARGNPGREDQFAALAHDYAIWPFEHVESAHKAVPIEQLEVSQRAAAALIISVTLRPAERHRAVRYDTGRIESAAQDALHLAERQRARSVGLTRGNTRLRRMPASALANDILAFELARSLPRHRRHGNLRLRDMHDQIMRQLHGPFDALRGGFTKLYPRLRLPGSGIQRA